MKWIDVISRITHVSTAITLVGGTVFALCILLPAAKRLSQDAHEVLATEIKNRWKPFVHVGILLFLVSGFYNFFSALPSHQGDSLYHALLGTKILLALVVFFIASALVGRSAKLQTLRDNRSFWLKVMVLLSAIIVAISGYVKVRGVAPKLQPITARQVSE